MSFFEGGGFDYALVIEDINLMATLVVATLCFVVGGWWYEERMFGERWQKLVELKKSDLDKSKLTGVLSAVFILTLVQALFLSVVMAGLGIQNAFDGLLFGLLAGVSFGASVLGIQYLYAQRKLDLFAIDAGYIVLQFALMGLIIGWWQ